MGIILCATSLGAACDDRQMKRQEHRILSKHQRYMDRQKNTETFQFIPRFKGDTLQAQLMLGLMIGACFVGAAEALDNKPPSPHCSDEPHSPQCFSQPGRSIVSTASILGKAGMEGAQTLTSATTSALGAIFCSTTQQCVQVSGSEVVFTGTEKQIDGIIGKLNDFSSLREKVIPPSPAAAKTQAHPNPQFAQWTQVQESLGVSPDDLKNMAVSECSDCSDCAESLDIDPDKIKNIPFCSLDGANSIIAISYKGLESGRKSFNQKVADSYLETLKQESLFFDFLTHKNKDVITKTDEYIFVNYGIFNDYFGLMNPQKTSQAGIYSTTIPLQAVLKRLMAAISGEVSLEQTSVPGEFYVRTTTLGDRRTLDEKQFTPPIIDIVIDRSGSMSGNPIDTINKNLPVLLQNFQNELGKDEFLKINVYALDDTFSLSQSFFLGKDLKNPKWKDIEIGGGTDLMPIGDLLPIKKGENSHRIVVAFTDGEHAIYDKPLDANYYSSLKDLQNSGSFVQPFLCKVGPGSDAFFQRMAQIFSGAYSKENTINDCIERVTQAIPSLLVSKEPLVLTINGNNQVIWLANDQPGMQTSTLTVHEQDTITLGKFKATVHVETKEEKKAKLLAALAVLEAGEEG